MQVKIFPIYFALQTALPVAMALTYPGRTGGRDLFLSGMAGVLDERNRTSVLLPIAGMFVTAALNMFVLLPASRQTIQDRKKQGKTGPLRFLLSQGSPLSETVHG